MTDSGDQARHSPGTARPGGGEQGGGEQGGGEPGAGTHDTGQRGAGQLGPGEPRSFGNGRYVVQRRLGAGNFATVYLAQDERLAVQVAVKLLSDRWSWEPEVRGRFLQEARILRSLNDSRVVQIRDIAETEDGRPYLVMDYATEGTLEQRLVEVFRHGARASIHQLRIAARAIADALDVLHERRIAHRDIKPSNILITRASPSGSQPAEAAGGTQPPGALAAILRPGERLMLGDLGLAKDLTFDSGVTVGVGTAGYMAPEQMLPGARIDTRTDIFAASALMAQIVSGESPDPMRRVTDGTITMGRPLPASIPAPLQQALLKGLDADPTRRPQTIWEWLTEVDRALVAVGDETVGAGAGAGGPAPFGPRPPGPPVPPGPGPGFGGSPGAGSPGAGSPGAGLPVAPGAAPPAAHGAQVHGGPGSVFAGPATAIPPPYGGAVPTMHGQHTLPGQHAAPGPAAGAPAHAYGGGTGSPVAPRAGTGSRTPQQRRRIIVGIGAVVVAVVVVLAIVITGGGDDDPTDTAGEFTVDIDGPREIIAGVPATWTVDAPGAVSGTWSLVSTAVRPDPEEWSPGDGFRGTWNAPDDRVTLTLDAEDEDGNRASDSITFSVEPAPDSSGG